MPSSYIKRHLSLIQYSANISKHNSIGSFKRQILLFYETASISWETWLIRDAKYRTFKYLFYNDFLKCSYKILQRNTSTNLKRKELPQSHSKAYSRAYRLQTRQEECWNVKDNIYSMRYTAFLDIFFTKFISD